MPDAFLAEIELLEDDTTDTNKLLEEDTNN